MGYTPYRTMVMIPEGYVLIFSTLIESLKHKFSRVNDVKIETDGANIVIVRYREWSFRIYWEDQPHVALESREIADRFNHVAADHESIATCSRRLTTAGDPDPEMRYFNDYVFVLEVFEALSGVFIFDPEGAEIRKTI